MASAAGFASYRFPGGSVSDQFHFNTFSNLGDAYGNAFPQFAQFVATMAGTGIVTLDYGSGSPQEAAAELAYLIGSPSDTTTIGTGIEWAYGGTAWTNVNWQTVGYWAALRAASPLAHDDGLNFLRIGHPNPFSTIKYWEVGNEIYYSGETDHHGTAGPGGVSTGSQHDPQTYAAFAAQFATFATEIVNTAGLAMISIGIDSGDPTGVSDNNWTQSVLADGKALGFVPGFISDHFYVQQSGAENDYALLNQTVTAPTLYNASTRYANYEAILQQTLGSQAASVQVLASEYNSVPGNPGKQTTSLVDGLFVANTLGGLLNSGYSGADIWDLRDNDYNASGETQNNINSLYGWRESGDLGILGGTQVSSPPATSAYIAYPAYYALQLFSKIDLPGAEVVSAGSSYSDLDVYAALEPASDNDDLVLLVVNTNPAAAITDQIGVTGFQPSGAAQVWQYGTAQDTAQSQSSSGASSLASSTTTLVLNGAAFSYTFPAYSMTLLDLKVRQTLTSVSVSPSVAALSNLGTQQFTATALDQFHNAMASQPAFYWSLTGPGMLTQSGFYSAPYASGLAYSHGHWRRPLVQRIGYLAGHVAACGNRLGLLGGRRLDGQRVRRGRQSAGLARRQW